MASKYLRIAARLSAPAVLAMSVVYAWLMLLPWNPPLPAFYLDASWQQVLPHATLNGWQFGKDIVFTYGPLGWLAINQFHPIHPELFATALAAQAFLILMVVVGTQLVAWKSSARPSLRAVAGAVLTLLVVEAALRNREVVVICLVWSSLLLWFLREERGGEGEGPSREPVTSGQAKGPGWGWAGFAWALFDLGVMSSLAMVALYKFSYGAMIAVLVAGMAVDAVLRRRFPWQGLAFLAFCGGLWFAAGQSLSTLWPYVRSSLEIAKGYGMAMQMRCTCLELVLLFATALGVVAGTVWAKGPIPWRRLCWMIAIMAAVLMLVLKASLVRADFWHMTLALYAFPIVAILSIYALQSRVERVRRIVPLGVVLVVSLVAAGVIEQRNIAKGNCRRPGIERRQGLLCAARDVLEGKSDYARAYGECMKPPAGMWHNVSKATTIDLYPFDVAFVLASGGRYQPRPVIQSYSAYTPALAALNAQHLRSDNAPDLIYFRIQTIDGQYPSLADGPSWPELMTRYDLDPKLGPAECGTYLPLWRSERPRAWKLELLEERQVSLNEPVTVPSAVNGPIWAEVDVQPRTWTAALNAAISEPILLLQVDARTGSREYRLPRGMAAAGFLLSPYIEDNAWFTWVASTRWQDPAWQRWLACERVQQILFRSKRPQYFRAPVRVKFYRLNFEGWNNRRLAFAPEHLALFELVRDKENRLNGCYLADASGRPALFTLQSSAVMWKVSESNPYAPLPASATTIKVQYGLTPSVPGGVAGPSADSSSFAMFTVDEQYTWKQIWAANLAPSETERLPVRQAEVPVRLSGIKAIALIARKPVADESRMPVWFGLLAE
jgi:hypothetical protein